MGERCPKCHIGFRSATLLCPVCAAREKSIRENIDYLSKRAFSTDTSLQEARREVERLCAALPLAIKEMERLSQESLEVHARMHELRQKSGEVPRG